MNDAERRYREIFERTPVALWEEDYTRVVETIEQLRAQGIEDFDSYFTEHPEVVVDLASKVAILDVNQYSLILYQASSKEELLTSIDKPFNLESFPMFKDMLVSLTRGESLFQAEAYLRTLRGERLHVFAQVQMLEPHDGRIRALLTLLDISRRKEMEEAVRQMNYKLEHSNRELERSNQELEVFASVVSHDLQEPLRMISSYTQLLAKRYQSQLDKRADKYIHYIVDGVQRMRNMVTDLLELSRVGTRSGIQRVVPCSEILEQVLHGLRVMLEESQATVTYDELPSVYYDPSQLAQLLQNLVSNAVKFRGQDAPRVHISARQEDHQWIISVRDNGIGIPVHQQQSVFEIFKRLHSRDKYPGTGMGLSIVKRIVERHGGRIWLESVMEQGTTFYFTIAATNGRTKK